MKRRHKEKHQSALHIRCVPSAIKDRFKAYCARRGYTVQGAAIALFKLAAEEDIPLNNARRIDGK